MNESTRASRKEKKMRRSKVFPHNKYTHPTPTSTHTNKQYTETKQHENQEILITIRALSLTQPTSKVWFVQAKNKQQQKTWHDHASIVKSEYPYRRTTAAQRNGWLNTDHYCKSASSHHVNTSSQFDIAISTPDGLILTFFLSPSLTQW